MFELFEVAKKLAQKAQIFRRNKKACIFALSK
jgi:hypothetical protein